MTADEIRCSREPLVAAITAFLEHHHASRMREIRARIERAIDEAGPNAIDGLGERLAQAGTDWGYFPGDALARRIHHVLAQPVLRERPLLQGTEYLPLVADKPLVIFANHLSYADANILDVLLHDVEGLRISDRMTVVAGPKVYSNLRRRFSSLCFGTVKVPQSTTRSSGEAVMDVRDVARAARRSITIAHERLRLGEALLVFPEGSRSRSGGMQPLLPGVARYLDVPGTWVMPVAISGSERLFPIAEDALNPVSVVVRLGQPIPAGRIREVANRDRQLIMDAIGYAIADLLPVEYRGVYAIARPGDSACEVSRRLFGEPGSA